MAKKQAPSELQIPVICPHPKFDNITALWLRMTNPSWPLWLPDYHHSAEYLTVKGRPFKLKPDDRHIIALANYEHLRTRLAELISQVKTPKTYPPPATLAAMIRHAMEPAEAGDPPEELEQLRWRAVNFLSPHMAVFFTSLGLANDRPPSKPRTDEPTPRDIENVWKVMEGMNQRATVESIRKAVREAGYSMSNPKIGKAVEIIRGK